MILCGVKFTGIFGGLGGCWSLAVLGMRRLIIYGIGMFMFFGMVLILVLLCICMFFSYFCLILLSGIRGIRKDFIELLFDRYKKFCRLCFVSNEY